jgi:two-component system OmpR family response regulator
MNEGWSVRPANGLLHVGPLAVNTAEHFALKDGKRLPLTVTEYRLLHYLVVNAGTVVTSKAIAKNVWGYDDPSTNEIVRVTVYRLRRKIEDDPLNPQLLKTVPGVGVILRDPR